MAELRNGGTSRSAVASSVSTPPSASRSPTCVDARAWMRERTRSSASSTLSVETAVRAALGLVGIVTESRSGLGRVDRDLRSLEADPHLATLGEMEIVDRGGRPFGDAAWAASDRHPHPVALPVEP